MTGQAIFLKQRKALVHRIVRLQRRIGQQGREALRHRGHALDAGDFERPLLRADVAGLRIGPHQVKRPGAVFAFGHGWPRLFRVFNRQPGPGTLLIEQRSGGHLGGKAVQRHRLQMIVRLDTSQQRSHRHGAVAHVPFIGNVVADVDGLNLRMLEQRLGLPGATVRAQLQIQLCGQQGRAEQQGPQRNKLFQWIAIPVMEVPQRLAQPRWPG
ncbi:hypothetical protein D3C84_671360 [compost metagenome]